MSTRRSEPVEKESLDRDGGSSAARSEGLRYRAVFEAADDAVMIADLETQAVLEANRAACELFGRAAADFEGLSISELHARDDDDGRVRIERELRTIQRARHPNLRFVKSDGAVFWGELRARVFESERRRLLLLIVRDVSERVSRERELAQAYESLKDAQAQLVHAGKLAAVGQLAAGVAHEVNNPATFILTNLKLMREHVGKFRAAFSAVRRGLSGDRPLPAERRIALESELVDGTLDEMLRETAEMVDDNLVGIERIANIVRDLRTFSRIDRDDTRRVQINEVVDAACNLAFTDIRHRARLIKEFGKVTPIIGEPGKLAQVFTNLLVNAAHAIDEGAADEHEIRVRTFEEGDRVKVTVTDTGCGIPAELHARIFEPFFTTKPREQGTGLGLSLCAEIVRKHGGDIRLESTPGRGSRFEVSLPRCAEPEVRKPPAVRAPSLAPPRERLRILVVDDDPAVLRAYRRLLGSRHDVVLVSGGKEALAQIDRDGRFDAIICDVMMPQVDGPMVYDSLRQNHPEMVSRLIFCSGGAFTPRAKEFLASVRNPFIPKPIESNVLEQIIQEVGRVRAS